MDPGTTVDNVQVGGSVVTAFVIGGATNSAVLIWLALQYVKVTNRLSILETHIKYLRREVAYANGRAEPDEEQRE